MLMISVDCTSPYRFFIIIVKVVECVVTTPWQINLFSKKHAPWCFAKSSSRRWWPQTVTIGEERCTSIQNIRRFHTKLLSKAPCFATVFTRHSWSQSRPSCASVEGQIISWIFSTCKVLSHYDQYPGFRGLFQNLFFHNYFSGNIPLRTQDTNLAN